MPKINPMDIAKMILPLEFDLTLSDPKGKHEETKFSLNVFITKNKELAILLKPKVEEKEKKDTKK